MAALGYRFPPKLTGNPDPSIRSTEYWLGLSDRQKQDFLTSELWNHVARGGVLGGQQTNTSDQMLAEYQEIIAIAKWFAEILRAGFDPVVALEMERKAEQDVAIPNAAIDYRLNGMLYLALPVFAPEFISQVDGVIRRNP